MTSRALSGAIFLTLLASLLAPFNTLTASACPAIAGTAPPGAQIGADCAWHLPDGSVVQAITTAGQPIPILQTSDASAGDKDVPWQILLPGAFIIPISVLVIFSRIKPRGGGH